MQEKGIIVLDLVDQRLVRVAGLVLGRPFPRSPYLLCVFV